MYCKDLEQICLGGADLKPNFKCRRAYAEADRVQTNDVQVAICVPGSNRDENGKVIPIS